MNFWKDKRVLVTGGSGFVGSYVVEMLVSLGARVTVADSLINGNTDNLENVKNYISFFNKDLHNFENCSFVTQEMDAVLNMAARVGGIMLNNMHPGTMFRDNLLINLNMLEAARINAVERYLVVSSACVYPENALIPTPESEGFVGVPESTNDGYGWAKRMAEFQAMAYAREYGMKIAIARPYNAYGPRDHFEADRSHVIPALIKRILDGEDPLVVWGSGEQTRAFLYVSDFARGVIELIEKYPIPDPVNIGTDEEIKIKDLVALIIKIVGKSPKVIFDSAKPSGHMRRNCNNSKAKEKIGFVSKVKLDEGLNKTIAWYLQKKGK